MIYQISGESRLRFPATTLDSSRESLAGQGERAGKAGGRFDRDGGVERGRKPAEFRSGAYTVPINSLRTRSA
jgi:hypothetical protein